MMQFLLAATVFTSCCLLQFKVTVGQHANTKFTVVPPPTVFGILGSDVSFHWNFSFGDWNDWLTFEQIYWGQTDNNDRIRNKYLTVKKDESVEFNKELPPSLKSRLNVTKTINQHGCSVHFVLQNLTWSDQDHTYGCTAEVYGVEFKEGPIRIDIQVPPKIIRRSSATVDKEEGEDVKLLCNASGDPKPFIRWTKNGKLLQNSNTTEFLISKIERKDGGSYVCTASNPAGSAFYSVFVRVLRYRPYIDTIASSNPMIKSWLAHVTSFKCVVDANPAANFRWFKDGRLISSGIVTTHGVSTLTITPSTAGDFGRYSCKATNDKGTAWHNVTVEQLFPPGPPVIKELKSDFLSISATWNRSRDDGGSPTLAYRITLLDANKKQQQMQSGIKQNKYTLQNLKHNRTYTILLQAGNIVGYGKPANVTVSTLQADPPRVLSVTAVPSLMAVNISWNSTNNNTGVKILNYRVLLIDTVTQQQLEFTGINVSKLYIANLTHNRTYVVNVQARSEDGYGWFKRQSFRTLEADPPGPPTIKVFPRTFALELTWNSSAQDVNNIKILDYRIKVLDGAIVKQELPAITGTSFTIEKLARNRTYFIELQARNEVGYGETAKTSGTTLLVGPPDAPRIKNITVDGKRCSLQWARPYNGESPVEVYTVSVWKFPAGNGSKEAPITWNTTETRYTLVDLQWNQNYTTAVSAWNKHGQSFYGVERQFRTAKFPDATVGTEVLVPSPFMTEEISSTKDSETYRTKYPTVAQGANKEKGPTRNSFTYLAPLWVVVMAFAIPAVVFMLWKFTQKILLVHVCKRRPRSPRRRQHNRDSESSATTLCDVNERTITNHYETITEILEMHYHHGYTTEDGKGFENEKLSSLPGYNVYNHLYETPLGSGFNLQQIPKKTKDIEQIKPDKVGQKELKSGLGMFPNNVYSHLIHGDSLNNRQYGVNGTVTVRPKSQWEISRDRLKLEKTIGSGEFGVVKKGLALNVNRSGGWVRVAVKTLNDNGEANELRNILLSELKVMKNLSPHKHVVQLLACITESEPVCVITEFAPYGDLLGFLRKKRGLQDGYYNIDHLPRKSLTSQQLMQFASDIADGMAYLSSQKIVHRDLAARNVLLGENLTCKVTDFGMARDIRGQDLYQKNTGGRLPVKWTALEALLHGRYTSKSDVWSFGVVLFEIVTIGGSPYPGMEVLELIDKLEFGYRMEKPRHVADEVYALMLSCWDVDPDKRPTFLQLYSILNKLAKEKQGCVNLRAYDGRLYENFTPA